MFPEPASEPVEERRAGSREALPDLQSCLLVAFYVGMV